MKIQSRLPAIERMTDACGIKIVRVEYLPGGRTNESYVIYSENEKYLARIAGVGTEEIIDRNKEVHNVSAAQKIGVAPKLLCAIDGNLLLQYVDGISTTDTSILRNPESMRKITLQLRRLHAAPPNSFLGKFDFLHDYLIYRNNFLSTGWSVPDVMQRHEQELYEMTKWVNESCSDNRCPCHSDVVIQNMIITKERAYIVDWEYSTVADRYLDLASFCIQNDLTKETEELFLKSYFEDAPVQLDREKLLLYKMAISFMWVYWHLSNVAHNKDIEYNERRWRQRLRNALDNKAEWERFQRSPAN